MKIQSLGIIFILIVLPITLVIAEYSHTQFDTLVLENRFDSALVTATYDALKSFQLNTLNDPHSEIADRKISSIEASANAFYNSMQTGLSAVGYSMEDLYVHTPAIVYTMYDGYYIYSPYTNIAQIISDGDDTTPDYVNNNLNSTDIRYGFKPYIYYSCRYVVGTDSDFVITYSLDNYISIVGMINDDYVNDAGYLISPETLKEEGGIYKYNGIEITEESPLQEYIRYARQDGNLADGTYSYIKINGTKYYLEGNETSGEIFYLQNGKRMQQVSSSNNKPLYDKYVNEIKHNDQAINYYKDAYEFTRKVLNIGSGQPYGNVLRNLRASNAVDKEGSAITLETGDYEIFADSSANPIEYPISNFNEQRKAVIRYAIESNLSVSIANFNAYSNSTNDFQMPKLKETDWDLIENQVSIISFLQGINIGTKSYNGYAVVTNDKTEEVVKEEDIYITTSDGSYHKVNDRHFADDDDIANNAVLGVLNTDFQVRRDINSQAYFYPKAQLGCYTSIVSQNNVDNRFNSIYEYLASGTMDSDHVKELYYTALGRERWATYKVSSQTAKTIQDLE